jgi:hypothetical protein
MWSGTLWFWIHEWKIGTNSCAPTFASLSA